MLKKMQASPEYREETEGDRFRRFCVTCGVTPSGHGSEVRYFLVWYGESESYA